MNKRQWLMVCTVAMIVSAYLWNTSTVNGDEWQPISQEELKMISVPEAPGAPAVI